MKDIQQQLAQNRDLSAVLSPQGETLLHVAACHGLADVVELLLSHNARVDAVDADGYTSLHVAVAFGHVRRG